MKYILATLIVFVVTPYAYKFVTFLFCEWKEMFNDIIKELK